MKLPIYIYNIPGRSVVDMTPETMGALAKAYGNIVGVKDATGDVGRVSRQRYAIGPDFIQLSGEDMTALAAMAAGGHGCIGHAHVAPELCSEQMEAVFRNDWDQALKLEDRLAPLDGGDLRRAGRQRRREMRDERARPRAQRDTAAARPGEGGDRARHRRAMVHAGLLNA